MKKIILLSLLLTTMSLISIQANPEAEDIIKKLKNPDSSPTLHSGEELPGQHY